MVTGETIHNAHRDDNVEQAILSVLLTHPEENDTLITKGARAEDFANPINRAIYEAQRDVYLNQGTVDIPLILAQAHKRTGLSEDETKEYLLSIVQDTHDQWDNFPVYITKLRKLSQFRKLYAIGMEIQQISVNDTEGTVSDAVNKATGLLDIFSKNETTGDRFKTVETLLLEAYARINEAHNNPNITDGIQTGYTELDRYIGLRPKELTIVGARPGTGKSSFALNILLTLMKQGRKTGRIPNVLVYSLEMSDDNVGNALLSIGTGIPTFVFRNGTLSKNRETKDKKGNITLQDEWEDTAIISSAITNRNVQVSDNPKLTPSMLRSDLRQNKGTELVIIDYLQLMSTETEKEEYAKISELSRALKLIAKEYNVPILALAQVNRESEKILDPNKVKTYPEMHNLRGSGTIEQDADIILMLGRKDPETLGVMIEKNRFGESKKEILLGWNKKSTQITEKKTREDNV